MKKSAFRFLATGLLGLILPAALLAEAITAAPATAAATPSTWHAQTLAQALGNMAIFAFAGIALAIIGYKLFDKCTPGDLNREIVENRNVAAAIVAASVILGVSLIIVAAMLG